MGQRVDEIPYDVIEAAIQVAGLCFWYKDQLKRVFVKCGVPTSMWDRYATPDAYKFHIARNIFSDLENRGESGIAILRRIIEEFIALRAFPKEVDMRAAKEAKDNLQRLSQASRLETAAEQLRREERENKNTRIQEDAKRQNVVLTGLAERFRNLVASSDPQSRGYELERLLEDLFRLHGIEYRHSFRTATEQVDGAFQFRNFHYLVEAKWTRAETTVATLDSFRSRVSRRIESTRGCFISISGFRDEVVRDFESGQTRNVLLISGEDLALILEGRFTLIDALELKTTRAAHDGSVFVRLADNLAV